MSDEQIQDVNDLEEKRRYIPKTNEEINQLARDAMAGQIFSSLQFRTQEEMKNMTSSVFMAIPLGGGEAILNMFEGAEDEPGMFYEYIRARRGCSGGGGGQ
jgi:hypothetical protein